LAALQLSENQSYGRTTLAALQLLTGSRCISLL
jgi:hypothetical protein